MDNLPNMDPLSQYDYSYTNYNQLPSTEYNYNVKTEPYHLPVANNLPIPLQFSNLGTYSVPNISYENEKTLLPVEKSGIELPIPEFNTLTENQPEAAKDEEIDTKENIELLPQHRKRKPRKRGRTSNYWNKKIEDKNFPFYGCTICNVNYKTLQELDEHVTIHKGRVTSYDIRVRNQQKRKEKLKEMKRLKKLGKLISKKKGKIKKEGVKMAELEIEIKPEDGYIGTEKAADFPNPSTENHDQSTNEQLEQPTNNTTENPTKDETKHDNKDHDDKSKVKEPDDPRLLKLFKCFACQKQFSLSYYLRLHVRSHTDEKPYTCAACGQSFITASKLNRHNKRIHLSIRFQCRICYRFFSRFDGLTKHFDKKHADAKIEGEPYDYNAILPYLKELEEQLREQSELKDRKPKTEDIWGDSSTQNNLNNFATKDESDSKKEGEKEEFIVEVMPEHVIVGDNPYVKEKTEPLEEVVVEELKVEMLEEHLDGTLDESMDDHTGDDMKNDVKDDRNKGESPQKSQNKTNELVVIVEILEEESDSSLDENIDDNSDDDASNNSRDDRNERKSPATSVNETEQLLYNELDNVEMIEEHLDDTLDETDGTIIIVGDDASKDSFSDEDYFPSNTWAAPPKQEPSSPGREVPEKSKRKRHKSSDFPMKCEHCDKTINSNSYYRIHMRTHTGERPYKCYVCNKGFITSGKMHRHVMTHQEYWDEDEKGEKKIKTEDMKEVKQENEEEEEGTKKKKTRKCKISSKTGGKTKSNKLIKKEGCKMYKRRPHACLYCNKRFLHLDTLQIHSKSHKGQELVLKCSFCLEVLPDEASLKDHEAAHTGPRPYVCTVCNKTYTKRETMIYHRKMHEVNSGEKANAFICDICSKTFNAQCKLQRHIVSHKVEKFVLRYECPVCAHMFHTKYHIQMHLTTHQKEGLILEENRSEILAMVQQNARKIPKKPDNPSVNMDLIPPDERSRVCNICGQVFQHFYYLEEHIKSHASKIAIEDEDKEEEKKHICPVCNKGFKLHYYLKLHSFTHTKEKPFICQQCGKGFITKGKLKRHLETHTGLKKYQCHICYKFFTRPSYLRIHVRTIHGTQDYNFSLDKAYLPIGSD